MNDWDGFILNRIDNDISWYDLLSSYKKQDIASIIGRLHAPAIENINKSS
jgi:hypothetical protein